MNWEAIGAVGEVLGAVGVILTLGYLAVQIRQNTAMMTVQTVQASVTPHSGFCCIVPSTLTCEPFSAKPARMRRSAPMSSRW